MLQEIFGLQEICLLILKLWKYRKKKNSKSKKKQKKRKRNNWKGKKRKKRKKNKNKLNKYLQPGPQKMTNKKLMQNKLITKIKLPNLITKRIQVMQLQLKTQLNKIPKNNKKKMLSLVLKLFTFKIRKFHTNKKKLINKSFKTELKIRKMKFVNRKKKVKWFK